MINQLYDDHRVFINTRDSEVGENIERVFKSSHYYHYWSVSEQQPELGGYSVIDIGDNYLEYRFEKSVCKWALKVINKTGEIISWHFISNANECGYKRFYEGPF